jgi:hypothetical protein
VQRYAVNVGAGGGEQDRVLDEVEGHNGQIAQPRLAENFSGAPVDAQRTGRHKYDGRWLRHH